MSFERWVQLVRKHTQQQALGTSDTDTERKAEAHKGADQERQQGSRGSERSR